MPKQNKDGSARTGESKRLQRFSQRQHDQTQFPNKPKFKKPTKRRRPKKSERRRK